jgi:hypothetical protein
MRALQPSPRRAEECFLRTQDQDSGPQDRALTGVSDYFAFFPPGRNLLSAVAPTRSVPR